MMNGETNNWNESQPKPQPHPNGLAKEYLVVVKRLRQRKHEEAIRVSDIVRRIRMNVHT